MYLIHGELFYVRDISTSLNINSAIAQGVRWRDFVRARRLRHEDPAATSVGSAQTVTKAAKAALAKADSPTPT